MFFYWANTNQVSRITTDSTPLKFVCTRNLTSVDSLTFSRPIRNAVSYIRFLGAVSKISRICKIVGVFVHCLLPSPSPPSFRLRVSFRAAVTFTLRTTKKKKNTLQEPPATKPTNNNINQTLKENKTNWQKHDARPARCKKRFTFSGKWTELGVKKQSCFSLWRN